MLSKAFLAGVIFGEGLLFEETLLMSFYRYIAKDEEATLHQAIREGNISEEFVDLLDRFECRKIPTKENATSLILEVAHKEIVQKPQYIADPGRMSCKQACMKVNCHRWKGCTACSRT